ncbi:MAG: ribonuclease H-like domain-containing protein [Lachnospiraceae bacterium]|nr:ribonuclease H-like domain-containing protein [Lachnospiraceae bacterium]
MQTTKKSIPLGLFPSITEQVFTEDTLFFDIETTGFSAKKSDLYLIGVGYRRGDEAVIEQFLADDATEQVLLLERFAKLLESHATLLTYNGAGFDLPYLKEKFHAYASELHTELMPFFQPASADLFSSHTVRDLYKELTPLRGFLGLPNLKQKTVEAFLHLAREDTYSGGDLIPIYRHYAATHDDLPKGLLLLHNYEDVLGMLQLLPMLSYPAFLNGDYRVEDISVSPSKDTLQITLMPSDPFPARAESVCTPFSLVVGGNAATLSVQLLQGELKYFFPDPENYYYLPDEDTAIHRSVGNYVDRKHRVPAKKSNCYIRKTDIFVPQTEELYSPAFRMSNKDMLSYFTLPETFEPGNQAFRRYINACLQVLVRNTRSLPIRHSQLLTLL